LLIAVGLTLLTGLWVRQAEILVLATQITESIPAIPSLAALPLLLLLNALLRRQRRIKPLARGEILVIFLFLAISSTMMGIGVMQFLIALIACPFYFTTDGISTLQPALPAWLVPHDTTAIRWLFEGAPDGRVPWHLWITPGLCWLGFFLALWWTLYCLMALFYRAWALDERLSFPLVTLPMEMTRSESGSRGFFRNWIMWLGFGLAAFYNLENILHAYYPSVPAFGKEVDFGVNLTALPWSAMQQFSFFIRPELIGLGFLVSTEISLTLWLSYMLMKLGAVFAAAYGYEPNHLYPSEQGIGAYLALACFVVWSARRRLAMAWRSALAGRQALGPEGMRYRWAFVGLILGFLAVWGFATAAGIAAWISGVYLFIVVAVALVYGRMRAQTGVPMIWLFPDYMQKSVLIYTFGSRPFAAAGPTTMATWALFLFLARGYYPTVTGYQIEAMEIVRRANLNPRRIALALTLSMLLGFVLGWYHHLVPYYYHGAVHLRDGHIWGTYVAQQDYQEAVQFLNTPRPPELQRIWATGAGSVIVILLSLLRVRFAGFPFHPLGYAMTCCFGDVFWGPFLLVWLLKTLTLRYGGMRLYRRAVPFFLGLALGHFAVAGIFWGLIGAWSGQAVQGYQVWFG
jgi:hypothetical protein